MLKIPVNIVLSLTTLVIVVGVALLLFGSPECDDMANTTAFHIKMAIDEVSRDSFPIWDEEGIPPDEQIAYYRSVPVALCQEKGSSVIDNIFGTTLEPQYQIYYEIFPESGGGIWTEAYPWSGGAASSLRTWAYMRVGVGAFKIASSYLTKAGILKHGFDAARAGSKAAAEEIQKRSFREMLEFVNEELPKRVGGEIGNEITSGNFLIGAYKTAEASKNIAEGVKSGWLTSFKDRIGRLVLRTDEIPVEIGYKEIVDGEEVVRKIPVFVKKEGDNIVDITTDSTKGWEQLKVSPKQLYNDFLETLPEETRIRYKSIYVFEDEVSWTETIVGKIKETNFYKEFYQPVENKLKKFIDNVEYAGYNVRDVNILTEENEGMILGTIDAIANDERVAKHLLNQDSIRNKFARLLGKSPDSITVSEIQNLMKNWKLNGISIIDRGSALDVIAPAIRTMADGDVIENSQEVFQKTYGALAIAEDPFDVMDPVSNPLKQVLEPTNTIDLERFKILQDRAERLGISIDEAARQAFNEINDKLMPNFGKNSKDLWSNYISDYLPDVVSRMESSDEFVSEAAAVEFGSFMGVIEQNKDLLPTKVVRSRTGLAADYFKAEAKKIVYLDGPQNLANPASFYSKGIFANMMTENCQGNSICLYSHLAMADNPFYLNESAKNFSGNIRVWRPVHPLQQWALWQAALQHVPAHPRFYLVSPCFANAKIWKTIYEDKPTIFVYPDKKSLEGEASNYCYADSDLVNQYTIIWALSDVGTLIEVVNSLSLARATKGLSGTALKTVENSFVGVADKVMDIVDPVTLAQGIAEGFISWPGWPFEPLGWDEISKNAGKVGIERIETGKETEV